MPPCLLCPIASESVTFVASYTEAIYFTLVFRWLSLSSNCIEKITNLNGMSEYIHSLCFVDGFLNFFCTTSFLESLKILSLGRNLIKNLTGLVSNQHFWKLHMYLIIVLILSRKQWQTLSNSCGSPTTSLRS